MQAPQRSDFTILFKLALPLVLSGLVEGSIGFFSTLFLARLGKDALAAGALVAWLFATLMVILWGTLTSVSVLVSRKYGEKNHKAVSLVLRDSLLLSCFLTIPVFIVLWFLPAIFVHLGQTPEIAALAEQYLHGLAWAIWPDFVGLVLLQFIIGLGHTRTNMFFTLIWVPINLLFNYVLVFGKLGFPSMGIAGVGWGATVSYWLTTSGLIAYMLLRKQYRFYLPNILFLSKLKYLKEIALIGLPMGGMYCLELGFFLALTVFMGFLGDQVLAANQITLQFMGQLTTVTFAIAGAITIRMGHMLGAKEVVLAERAAVAGVSIAFAFMTVVAFFYWFLPYYLISIDFDISKPENQIIYALAKKFLALAAIFQLLEACRISLYGALRALQDTKFTFLSSFISFWCVPVPLAYLFAVVWQMQGFGAWCAMILGALAGVGLLAMRFKNKMHSAYGMSARS